MKLSKVLLIIASLGFSGVTYAQTSQTPVNGGSQSSPQSASRVDRSMQKVDDMQIARKVHDMLAADSTLSQDSKNISVMSDSGIVILKGRVPSTAERSRIEELVKRAPGVRSVQNMTEITNTQVYE